jgi:hypothetical protein
VTALASTANTPAIVIRQAGVMSEQAQSESDRAIPAGCALGAHNRRCFASVGEADSRGERARNNGFRQRVCGRRRVLDLPGRYPRTVPASIAARARYRGPCKGVHTEQV